MQAPGQNVDGYICLGLYEVHNIPWSALRLEMLVGPSLRVYLGICVGGQSRMLRLQTWWSYSGNKMVYTGERELYSVQCTVYPEPSEVNGPPANAPLP